MIKCLRRKCSPLRLVAFAALIGIGHLSLYIYSIFVTKHVVELESTDNIASSSLTFEMKGKLRERITSLNDNQFDISPDRVLTRKLLNATENYNKGQKSTIKRSEYPPDIFSLTERRRGAVVLHVIGMLYMFLALAVVCDEFFIPSLGVIIDVLKISEDVAGATFMAAGGSAPELFTSFIGLFIARNHVGIGTIVGSAVFNILFVIAICCLVSKTVLELSWWPLFRDLTFYSLDLLILIFFYYNGKIDWYEALVLLLAYALYVLFMKFDQRISASVKHYLSLYCCKENSVSPSMLWMGRRQTCPTLKESNRYRQGALQLLVHTVNPVAIGNLGVAPCEIADNTNVSNGSMTTLTPLSIVEGERYTYSSSNHYDQIYDSRTQNGSGPVISNGHTRPAIATIDVRPVNDRSGYSKNHHADINGNAGGLSTGDMQNGSSLPTDRVDTETPRMEQEVGEKPFDVSWPREYKKRVMYVIVAPIMFLLYFTLPDVRKPNRRKLFLITFLGSIAWIGGFSYLMVWWANQTGETIGIEDEVMGLTILAAGTSIPDLITSVIVAKKGFADMAVSSSVGSNIFDITVGLPLPWIIYSIVNGGEAVNVNRKGLFCSIVFLFIVLMILLVGIVVSKWRLNKTFGIFILVLYVAFLSVSLVIQLGVFECPL